MHGKPDLAVTPFEVIQGQGRVELALVTGWEWPPVSFCFSVTVYNTMHKRDDRRQRVKLKRWAEI